MTYELEPKTRIEFFLAKVAGEDINIETLTPPVPMNEVEKALLKIAERLEALEE